MISLFQLIIALTVIFFITLSILIYRELKNAPLECSKCQYFISVHLNGQCPHCGYHNYTHKNYKG